MPRSKICDETAAINATESGRLIVSAKASKRVCWIVTKEITVQTFLLPLLGALSGQFRLCLIVDTTSARSLQLQLGPNIEIYPVHMERAPAIVADMFALMQICRILRRERFDVVHTVTPKAGLLGMLAAWYCQIPVRVHTFQGEVWASRTGLWRKFLKALDTLVARCASNVLVVSKSGREFLVSQRVVSYPKTKVLGAGSICGVDIGRFKPDKGLRTAVRLERSVLPQNTVFLFVGRMNRDKGVPELIAAFDSLLRVRPDARLWLVGPDEQNIAQHIEALEPASRNRIWLSNFRNDPETLMASADVLVLPSHREGFGMTVIEAAACGIPAIVSDVHGLSDTYIEGSTALTHSMGSTESLCACMLKFADSPELRQTFGVAARDRVLHEFSQQRVVSALMEYYRNLFDCKDKASLPEEKS